ncbi:hypothetical protein [Deinococcus ruber]|uniref:hypothetical protein n=1 Tax=Deinococcus ruber TaxID=1848197 RepID=UPI00166DCF3D|nr:hypothetical protein [Deinococcus ruber]
MGSGSGAGHHRLSATTQDADTRQRRGVPVLAMGVWTSTTVLRSARTMQPAPELQMDDGAEFVPPAPGGRSGSPVLYAPEEHGAPSWWSY